ncbi:catenin alpha-3 [Cricetulus griseus]|nr:catenin alpha-3 [Cricetulus griseus]
MQHTLMLFHDAVAFESSSSSKPQINPSVTVSEINPFLHRLLLVIVVFHHSHSNRKKLLTGKTEKSNTLNAAIDNMSKKTRDLRRQIRKAIIDHISDSFLDTTVPLLVLIEAAKNGREKEIKEYAAIFREHTGRLVESPSLENGKETDEYLKAEVMPFPQDADILGLWRPKEYRNFPNEFDSSLEPA